MKEKPLGRPEVSDGENWYTLATENWTSSVMEQKLKEVKDGNIFDILLLLDEVV